MLLVSACPESGFPDASGRRETGAFHGVRTCRPAVAHYSERRVLTSPASLSSPMSCGIGPRPPPAGPKMRYRICIGNGAARVGGDMMGLAVPAKGGQRC